MELLRKFIWRKRPEDTPKAAFPYPAREYFQKGETLAKKYEIDKHLQLKGDDQALLYMLFGLRFLHREIDFSQKTLGGKGNHTGEAVRMKFDSTMTQTLRETEAIVQDQLEEFISSHFQENLNRARTIQIAVNNLFMGRYDENGNRKA